MGAAPNESQTSVGGLVLKIAVPTVGLMLMFKALGGYQEAQVDLSTPEMSKEAIAKRIKPVGQISMPEAAPAGAAAVAKVEKSGEEVFNAVCTACHTTGAAGAPKFGDKGAWGARIAQGYDTLVKNAINGIRGMPARGGGADLTDGEVARAMVYMANKAGANFKAPEAPKPAAAPAEATKTAAKVDGKAVYEGLCVTCHGAGVAGAPKFGDKGAWGARIAQGKDTLYQHALQGFQGKAGNMPAKGGNAALSDDEVKAAVDFMAAAAK